MLIRTAFRWLCAAALIGLIGAAGWLEPSDRLIIDHRSKLADWPASGSIVIVGIDRRSLDALDSWPWPRRHHATLIDRLMRDGAARIAFDFDLSATFDAADDRVLDDALARAGPQAIALPFFASQPLARTGPPEPGSAPPAAGTTGLVTLVAVQVRADADGLVRRYPSDASHVGSPRLSLATWATGHKIGGLDSEFLVNLAIDADSIERVSYVDVLQGRFEPGLFADRLVFVGVTDASIGEQIAVPGHGAMARVVFHALAAESILQDAVLTIVDPALVTALVMALMLGFGPWLERQRWTHTVLMAGSFALLAFVLAAWLHIVHAWTFGPAPVLFGAASIIILTILRNVALCREERSKAKIADRRHRQLVEGIVENSLVGIVSFDEEAAIVSMNRAAQRIFRKPPDGCIGQPLEVLLLDHAARITAAHRNREPLAGEISISRNDELRLTLETALCSIDDPLNGFLGILFLNDVSETRAKTAALDHLLHHDVLTGLPNRELCEREARRLLDEASQADRRVAHITVTVESLVDIADVHGPEFGDALLVAFVRRLRAASQAATVIARTGMHDFAVLITDTDTDLEPSLEVFLDGLVEALAGPFKIADESIEADFRIGVALHPDHAMDAANLARCAGLAARSGECGRCSFYEPEADRRNIRRVRMHTRLREVIREEALSVVYQPKVDTFTLALSGAEALVRWRDPIFGAVSPAEFVPLAESFGLIDAVTELVLERVVADQRLFARSGLVFPVALNLSASTLGRGEGGRALLDRVRANGSTPATLAFEITETAIMNEPARAIKSLRNLCEAGFAVSLDDFGTGHSTVARLRDLPLTGVKIDRSLVRADDRDRGGEVVLCSIIDLARKLGLETIGEGVEEGPDLERLRRLGCDRVQGFLTGRPMAVPAFLDWFGVHAPRNDPRKEAGTTGFGEGGEGASVGASRSGVRRVRDTASAARTHPPRPLPA